MMKELSAEQFAKELRLKKDKVESRLTKALKLSCVLIRDTAIDGMKNTPVNPDISYYTNNKSIPHHPSLPYNPPAIDTGALRASVNYEVEGLEGRVGSTILDPPYGAYLELAEYGSSKFAPRPWLKPAVESCEKQVQKILRTAIARGLMDD